MKGESFLDTTVEQWRNELKRCETLGRKQKQAPKPGNSQETIRIPDTMLCAAPRRVATPCNSTTSYESYPWLKKKK